MKAQQRLISNESPETLRKLYAEFEGQNRESDCKRWDIFKTGCFPTALPHYLSLAKNLNDPNASLICFDKLATQGSLSAACSF